MLEHTRIKSRQCQGMSDPEGECPTPEMESPHSETASDIGPTRGPTKFDDPGPNVTGLGRMEEEHTSNTR